jgi:hypothetical protein
MENLDPFVVIEIIKHLSFDELNEMKKVNRFFRDLVPRVVRQKLKEYRDLSLEATAKAVLLEEYDAREANSLIKILNDVDVQELIDNIDPMGGYFYFANDLISIIRERTTNETILSSLRRNKVDIELAFALLKKRELKSILRNMFGMYCESLGQIDYSFKKQKFLSEAYDDGSDGPAPVWFHKLTGSL